MQFIRISSIAFLLFFAFFLLSTAMAFEPSPPQKTMKLVFIHHSVGENWLNDANGGLGRLLFENNYFVSDTNYGWGPDGIGDRTDIPNWPEWFTGPSSKRFLKALYRLNYKNSDYIRKSKDPGGENKIVMFKSCFPNSNLEGNPKDASRRHGDDLSVSNAKAIYNQLLGYFGNQKDKLFIAVTAPPVREKTYSKNARAFNNWLVNDWLKNYKQTNVAVFDFYNILTGKNNHHRISGKRLEHLIRDRNNNLYYYPGGGDNHPTKAGNRKAAREFVPFLNYTVNRWQPGEPALNPIDTKTILDDTAALPEKPVTVNTIQDGNQIDDFDMPDNKWEAFLDEANHNTKLSFRLDQTIKHKGRSSINVSYNVAPESWATLSHIMPSVMDWSNKSGLSLFIRMSDDQGPVTLVVYNGGHDNLKPFDYKIFLDKNTKKGWQKVSITWDMFIQPSWVGSGTDKFNPSQAIGIAFSFDESEGSFWADDLKFIP
ncbi:MAG: hypothetical protein GY699_15810 [Desulfobacteraceae bacterium]|nr:hypothetical protein [Desulfobacteraceae bacterium]